MIFIGSNDVRDALQIFPTDPSGVTSNMMLQEALTSVADGIQRLWWAGARNFLIANVPNVGLTPAVTRFGPGAQAVGDYLSSAFNAFLEANVLVPSQALPGIRILRLNAYAALNAAVVSGNFANVVDPCLEFFVIAQAMCTNPDGYLFWDAVHPTRAGHRVLAEAAALVLITP